MTRRMEAGERTWGIASAAREHRPVRLRPGKLAGTLGALALSALVSAVGGCGPTVRGPEVTLDEYRAALARADYATAYDMMSSDFRERHSREEFVRMMEESPREVTETVDQLGRARAAVEIRAELRYGLGERMHLVREGGRWRVATNPIQFYTQDTPRDALRSFLRAYRLKRWDVMLRFVPNRYRERMDAELVRRHFEGEHGKQMAERMKALAANIDAPITDKGDEARMPYGDRHEVVFVREDSVWKIQDLD